MDSAVVRIYATVQIPDYTSPWQAQAPSDCTGSGVVIGNGRILTGAHVVANATFVQVQKISDPDKVVAQVERVCHDSDLALLRVEKDTFMEDIAVAEIGELPALRDRVSVVGFPVGGEELSVTEGVVSRIEVQRYSHSQRDLLAVTIDAAINAGNSGGPVFGDGKVVGIAFQKLEDADNIGEMVPAPLLRKFLEGVELDTEPLVPGLGVATQSLENPTLRESVGLSSEERGIMVTSVQYDSSCWGTLEIGDVILEIDGHPVANNATIRYLGKSRMFFSAVLGDHFVGDALRLLVRRDGETREADITLKPYSALVPRNRYDTRPKYFVYAGLVFQTLSRDYLKIWRPWWEKAPPEFLNYYYWGKVTEDRQEVVALTQVLADEINVGYDDLYSEAIASVNGQAPKDLKDFVRLVEGANGQVVIGTSQSSTIVLDPVAVAAATPRILERYRITADRAL